jgi:anti-anti-sigma factor
MSDPITHARPFTTDCIHRDRQLLLRVSGRLVDLHHDASVWRPCLQRMAAADVRVDLGAVTDIDARGLGMLAELTRETRARGGRLAVIKASPRVRKILALTHLDGLLDDEAPRGPRLAA